MEDLIEILTKQKESIEKEIEEKNNDKTLLINDINILNDIQRKKVKELEEVKKQYQEYQNYNNSAMIQYNNIKNLLQQKDEIINSYNKLNQDYTKQKGIIEEEINTNFKKSKEEIFKNNDIELHQIKEKYTIEKKIYNEKIINEKKKLDEFLENETNKINQELIKRKIESEKELNKRQSKRENLRSNIEKVKVVEKIVEKIVEVDKRKVIETRDASVQTVKNVESISTQTNSADLPTLKFIEKRDKNLSMIDIPEVPIVTSNNYYNIPINEEMTFNKSHNKSFFDLTDTVNHQIHITGILMYSYIYKFSDKDSNELFSINYNLNHTKSNLTMKVNGGGKVRVPGPNLFSITVGNKTISKKTDSKLRNTQENRNNNKYEIIITEKLIMCDTNCLNIKDVCKITDIKKIETNAGCRIKYN